MIYAWLEDTPKTSMVVLLVEKLKEMGYEIKKNFEPISEETANGLYHSDRQVFRLLTYTPYDKVFSLGIRGVDYFGTKQWNWKELPIETFNQ